MPFRRQRAAESNFCPLARGRAGLRKYDVLREVGGVRLASTAMIERVVYNANVGDHIPFVAERNGKLWSGDILIEELK